MKRAGPAFPVIVLLSILVAPLAAEAQQAATVPRIGYLGRNPANPHLHEAFLQYILTEEKTERAVTVIAAGPQADLKPHGHNHRVTITGTRTREQDEEVFKASAIQHLDIRCS